jgi:hypothetical protein
VIKPIAIEIANKGNNFIIIGLTFAIEQRFKSHPN